MYEFEDYYEPSEYDQLINETVDKIKEAILERAKDDVEAITKQVEILNSRIDYLTSLNNKMSIKIREQQQEINTLNKNLEEKLNAIPHTKFKVGDKVYVIRPNCSDVDVLKCPTCNGRGYIDVETVDYGMVNITCPDCHNNYCIKGKNDKYYRELKYNKYTIDFDTVRNINMHISDTVDIKYIFNTLYGEYGEDFVFDDRQDAINYAHKLSEVALKEAKEKMGVE